MAAAHRSRSFKEVQGHFIEHKDVICEELNNLETDAYVWFCFVKLLHCNAAYACSFSNAWCKTERNIESEDERFNKGVVFMPDLFNVKLVQIFMENDDVIEGTLTDAQLVAFERLAVFLDNMTETMGTISQARENEKDLKKSSWAAILGIHVLKKLAVSQQITFDSGYSDLTGECPCDSAKCKERLHTGDNSLGNRHVWHGSLDIIIGDAAFFAVGDPETESSVTGRDTAFEEKRFGKLEDSRSQIIAESITFTFLLGAGLTPLISFSHKHMKVFMYDKKADLLFESTEMPMFDDNFEEFKVTTVLVLWFLINYKEFCTGVKRAHEEVGYTADFKSFVKEPVLSVYEKQLQKGGCRHAKRIMKILNAADKKGKFKRFKCDYNYD